MGNNISTAWRSHKIVGKSVLTKMGYVLVRHQSKGQKTHEYH